MNQIRLEPTLFQNVVNYTVIVEIPNAELKLMPGMTANITVMIQQAQNVMKIPASALKFWPPQDYLDKAMKEYPDSVNKFLERLIEFRKRMTVKKALVLMQMQEMPVDKEDMAEDRKNSESRRI